METSTGVRIGRDSFLQSLALLAGLLVAAGVLTLVVPSGTYDRVTVDGTPTVVPGSYHETPEVEPIAPWRWATAPVEVLASADGPLTVVVLLFILLVGAAFAAFDASGVFPALLDRFLARWGSRRDAVIIALATVFMLLGAIFGILEEVVPLIPVVVLLALRLGWDRSLGLGLILLPVGFGFSAALFNPFTIGVAQRLAGVPLWSGFELRAVFFVVTWALLVAFLLRYRRRLEAAPGWVCPPTPPPAVTVDRRGWVSLAAGLGLLTALMVGLPLVDLADLSMPAIALGFVVTAWVVARRRGLGRRQTLAALGSGAVGVAPGLVLILLAMGVKHIVTTAAILDTLLHSIEVATAGQGPYPVALAMYLLVFLLQAILPSATAKAFLVIPLLTPLGDLAGITRQTVVLAFNFGDGFSHLLYPTNPLLLIALGLGGVSFGRWFRWTLGLQVVLFGLTLVFLAAAVAFGYGPR